MKKGRRRPAAGSHSTLSSLGSGKSNEPPANFVVEMVGLFNAGELDLFEKRANEAVSRWPHHFLGWKALGNLRLMQGNAAEAQAYLEKSVGFAPGDVQALNNLGSALLEQWRLEEAESRFRQALAVKSDYAQAHNNLGITLLRMGCFDDAAASYKQALAISPDFCEAHNNLGNVLRELGRLKEAEACYRQAVACNPDFAEAHGNLGNVLLERGRAEKAKMSFEQALKVNPEYARAHCGLGDIMLKRGRPSDAITHYRQCIDLDSSWAKAQDGLNKALGLLVPLWHVPMMNDRRRNDAYFAALQRAVTPESHVLEIGTGSGLLAMMAAKIGARKVTTCEAVPEIAETAQAIVAENGFTPPVTVIPKISSKLKIGKDMDEPADLLVSEILSSEFLGEGVLSSIEDAKRRLLKPGARIIPERGSIQFALFGGTDIEKNIRVDEVYGFDLSKFNRLVASKQYIERSDLGIELLTDKATAFFFDFVTTDRFPSEETREIELEVKKAGRCCGIIQWIRLEMYDDIVFENHPSIENPAVGWQHCVYNFPEAIDVQPGQIAMVNAAHNRIVPWFFFKGIK